MSRKILLWIGIKRRNPKFIHPFSWKLIILKSYNNSIRKQKTVGSQMIRKVKQIINHHNNNQSLLNKYRKSRNRPQKMIKIALRLGPFSRAPKKFRKVLQLWKTQWTMRSKTNGLQIQGMNLKRREQNGRKRNSSKLMIRWTILKINVLRWRSKWIAILKKIVTNISLDLTI